MSFTKGFQKTASLEEAGQIVSRLGKGLKASGGHSVGDTLKLKGLKHISEAVKSSGGVGKSLSTSTGRKALAEGVGKAAPALGTTAAYGYGAKKLYDKASGGNSGNQGYY